MILFNFMDRHTILKFPAPGMRVITKALWR